MNLEERLTSTFDDVLRSAGYIFEVITNNKRQSNIITGPNNQLIPSAVANQLAQSIALFDEILDDIASKFDDARWCMEQIADTRRKQEQLRAQDELERQKKAEVERKRKEEDATRKKKEENDRLLQESRAKEEEDFREKERLAMERLAMNKQALEQVLDAKSQLENMLGAGTSARENGRPGSAANINTNTSANNASNANASGNAGRNGNNTGANAAAAAGNEDMPFLVENDANLVLDLDKDDLLNPSDIMSTINYQDNNKLDSVLDNMDLDFDAVLNGQAVLDDSNMDMLDQEFDAGQGMEEDFDVDTFLNQIGNGG